MNIITPGSNSVPQFDTLTETKYNPFLQSEEVEAGYFSPSDFPLFLSLFLWTSLCFCCFWLVAKAFSLTNQPNILLYYLGLQILPTDTINSLGISWELSLLNQNYFTRINVKNLIPAPHNISKIYQGDQFKKLDGRDVNTLIIPHHTWMMGWHTISTLVSSNRLLHPCTTYHSHSSVLSLSFRLVSIPTAQISSYLIKAI